jgi:hypothetical protein
VKGNWGNTQYTSVNCLVTFFIEEKSVSGYITASYARRFQRPLEAFGVRISHSQLHPWAGGAFGLAPCEPCGGLSSIAALLLHAGACGCGPMLAISDSPLAPPSR